MKIKNSLILTAYPDAFDSWESDLDHVSFNNWKMVKAGSKHTDHGNVKIFTESLQGLIGHGDIENDKGEIEITDFKEKHQNFFLDQDLDMVVIDEAHYYDSDNRKLLINFIRKANPKCKVLFLSGTPMKMLTSGDFSEKQIFNFGYVKEREWIKKVEKENVNLFNNLKLKYRPEMKLYSIGLDSLNIEKDMKDNNWTEDEGMTLSKLFGTSRGKLNNVKLNNENMVKSFLYKTIGHPTKQTKSAFGFTHADRNPDGKGIPVENLNVTMWLLNGVDSCYALGSLINSQYENVKCIVAAGGNRDIEGEPFNNTLKKVRDEIKKAKLNDYKLIILTVGKLTTGVSIKEVGTCFNLTEGNSPEKYWQFGFRSKTPDNKKTISYIVDFAPTRAFEVSAEFIKSANSEVVNDDIIKEKTIQTYLKCFSYFEYVDGFNEMNVETVMKELFKNDKAYSSQTHIASMLTDAVDCSNMELSNDGTNTKLTNIVEMYDNGTSRGKTKTTDKDKKELEPKSKEDKKKEKDAKSKVLEIMGDLLSYFTDFEILYDGGDWDIFENKKAINEEFFNEYVSISADEFFNVLTPYVNMTKMKQVIEFMKSQY